MTAFMEEQLAIAKKIELLTISLSSMDEEDRHVTANIIKRLKHKLNDLQGKENVCDIEEGFCLSCGG
jgi:hypothetical protein